MERRNRRSVLSTRSIGEVAMSNSNSKSEIRAAEYRARAEAATAAAEACVLAQPRQQHEAAAARWAELAKGEEDRAAKRDILLGAAHLAPKVPDL